MKFYSYIKLIRLNKPTGIWLLFLPCLFSFALALKQSSNINILHFLYLIFLFFIGSILMRSAGCIINDLFDVKFDKLVSRTQNRAISSGEVSKKSAIIILLILLLLSLIILLQLNFYTILSGFFIAIFVAIYPLMKRISYYPQIFLGVTFNFGVIMVYLALFGHITIECLILYLSSIIWTIIYDTIYAFQDIEDDIKIGVKSLTIKAKNNPQKILVSLGFFMFINLLLLGFLSNFKAEFFMAILVADLYMNYKITKCDFSNPNSCLKTFRANIWVGSLILLAITLG
jgi:4-hydroxybenzoate polyprenyltransferase